jgi:PRC-barrel domain
MLAKYVMAGLAGSALLASVAVAQSPTATTDRATTPPAAASDSSFHGTWRASKVVGLNVYNDNNESIGSINDMLMDKSGSIKAVVIGVGGFLGVGEHLVAMSLDKVKFVNEPVAYSGMSSNTKPATGTTSSTTTTGAAPASTSKSNPWYPDHAMVSATKDQLKGMPEFKYSTE